MRVPCGQLALTSAALPVAAVVLRTECCSSGASPKSCPVAAPRSHAPGCLSPGGFHDRAVSILVSYKAGTVPSSHQSGPITSFGKSSSFGWSAVLPSDRILPSQRVRAWWTRTLPRMLGSMTCLSLAVRKPAAAGGTKCADDSSSCAGHGCVRSSAPFR